MSQSAFCIATSIEQVHEIMRCLYQSGASIEGVSILSVEGMLKDHVPVVAPKACKDDMAPRMMLGQLASKAQHWAEGLVVVKLPSLGEFLAVGPVIGALASMVHGSGRSGLASALMVIGIPSHDADHYARRIQGGGILVSAAADSAPALHKAWRILRHAGAEEVGDTHGRWTDDSTAELRPPNPRHGPFRLRDELTINRTPLRESPASTEDGAG